MPRYPVSGNDILEQCVKADKTECLIKIAAVPDGYTALSLEEVATLRVTWDTEIEAQIAPESPRETERKKWQGRTKESLTAQDIRDLTYYLSQRAGLI